MLMGSLSAVERLSALGRVAWLGLTVLLFLLKLFQALDWIEAKIFCLLQTA